jgi:uncharacterized C2H2 Zn-finger protein
MHHYIVLVLIEGRVLKVTSSPLFDRTHIVKGVPVEAEIELQCRKCQTLFHTINAYYIGYSPVNNANPQEQGKCTHALKNLVQTNNWFPGREVHKQAGDGSWTTLFDYSHILEGAPVDADIELECKKCKTLFYTKNAYYIGYSDIHYANPKEEGLCNHDLQELKPTKRYRGS